jgi:RNA polymerase sigma-70 factor (ECF subfamily)
MARREAPGGRPVASASMAQLSDDQLARCLAAGQPEAVAELYDRYGDLAYALALRITGDGARAEDVVQESFVKIWRQASRFDPRRGSLRAWVMAVVRNQSLDAFRGRAAHERRELDLAEVRENARICDPWPHVSASLLRSRVQAALSSLPTEQRRVVELSYFAGLTCREIGNMLELPLGTVKSRLRLGMEKLHAYFAGQELDLDE